MHTSADDNEDFSPDFDFDAASHIDSLGWTAVFRIPFASLRYTGKAEAGWRILVMRRVPREDHLLWTSVPIPLDTPSFIATMQPLQGVGVPADAQFLTVRPTLTVHRSSSTDPGQPTKDKSGLEASLDIKWRPRPELVVDGTVKPDFSQVALDVPQLSGNSSFALYLPEKRPFFFESSDLLRSPSQALYTRSFTQPQWGTRATWRGDRWSGAAFLIDDRGGGSTLLPYAYGTDSVTQPRSKAAAARLRADVPEVDGLFRGLELGSVMSLRRYEAVR